MLVFDFIHDESPLFSKALQHLLDQNQLKADDILIITMGKRWSQFFADFQQLSMTRYFEDLDKKNINIEDELQRISNVYPSANLYAVDRLLIEKPIGFQKKVLVYTFLFYEHLFDTNPVTHYFTTGIAYMYNFTSYYVAKKYSCKHVSFYDARLPGEKRTTVSFGISNRFDLVYQKYNEYQKQQVTDRMLQDLQKFRQKPAPPTYMKNLVNKQTINLVLIKEFFIRFKRYYIDRNSRYDYFSRSPFGLSTFKLKKFFVAKMLSILSSLVFDKVDYDRDKYFIFPLHMYPEASTLVLAKYYVNQLESIINISKTLPADIFLYVKEHKSALGERITNFYKRLKKYPNIKIISHRENTFELIRNAVGVITLSSTVGWEGLILKKPVIVLGDVFYNDTGLTIKIESFSQLEKSIKDLINQKLQYPKKDHDYKLAYYLYCLKENSFPFEFNVYKLDITDRLLDKENVRSCANCILAILE